MNGEWKVELRQLWSWLLSMLVWCEDRLLHSTGWLIGRVEQFVLGLHFSWVGLFGWMVGNVIALVIAWLVLAVMWWFYLTIWSYSGVELVAWFLVMVFVCSTPTLVTVYGLTGWSISGLGLLSWPPRIISVAVAFPMTCWINAQTKRLVTGLLLPRLSTDRQRLLVEQLGLKLH